MSSFSDFKLSEVLMKSIQEMGFQTPSPIQAQAIPMLLEEPTDFLGLAATGTGKTAAFSIPMLERIDAAIRAPQALILCPTRELALQVCGQIALLGRAKRVKPVAIYGGASYTDQIHGLRSGAQVVVGTPGRTVDHIEKGTLKLGQVQIVILDEADEMISMGFKEDLETILKAVRGEDTNGDKSNIWLFSATMGREVRRVADAYLKKPKQVQVNTVEKVPSTIEQLYFPLREGDKPDVLCRLIESAEDFYGLIFCQTKTLVTDLTTLLNERGFKADCLHGDKDQKQREKTMQSFRDRKVRILVCTDVASRGLDVKDITHVINYSLPRELDNYVHRIGRTARSGKTGVAMSLVTQSHRHLLFQIEKMTKSKINEGTLPSRRDVGAKKVSKVLGGFLEQPMHSRALEVMSEEWKTALAEMPAQEVAARFLALMMPETFSDQKRAAGFHDMMNAGTGREREGSSRGPRGFDGPNRRDRRSDRPERGPRHEEPRYEMGVVNHQQRAKERPLDAATGHAPAAKSERDPAALFTGRPARKSRFAADIRAERSKSPIKKPRRSVEQFSARSERPPRADRRLRADV